MFSVAYDTLRIFVQFLHRDIFIYTRRIGNDLFNYAVLSPLVLSVSFVYVQANIYFGNDSGQIGTIIFAGNILFPLMVMAYKITFELLFDLEKNRFIDYQITLLDPRLIILERIFFASIVSFFVTAPFFPVSKLILGNYFFTDNISWPLLFLVLFFGSFCTVSYHQFFAAYLRSYQIGMFWVRINHVLMTLAGAFIPIYTIKQYSPFLGYLIKLNPLLYLTEGIRQALFNSNAFLPIAHCIGMMSLFTLFFTGLTCWAFKKRVDHI